MQRTLGGLINGWSKYTPGERTSWETTTRSVPFTMNVPLVGHHGEIPNEHGLGLDFLGFVIDELGGHI